MHYLHIYCMLSTHAVVDCGPLQNPTNGMVDLSSSTIFMSIAIFTCDSGYTLEGIGFRQCLADGGWSSTEPICNGMYLY